MIKIYKCCCFTNISILEASFPPFSVLFLFCHWNGRICFRKECSNLIHGSQKRFIYVPGETLCLWRVRETVQDAALCQHPSQIPRNRRLQLVRLGREKPVLRIRDPESRSFLTPKSEISFSWSRIPDPTHISELSKKILQCWGYGFVGFICFWASWIRFRIR